jgi:hypothetical protein
LGSKAGRRRDILLTSGIVLLTKSHTAVKSIGSPIRHRGVLLRSVPEFALLFYGEAGRLSIPSLLL